MISSLLHANVKASLFSWAYRLSVNEDSYFQNEVQVGEVRLYSTGPF